MACETTTTSYAIPEPFGHAMESLRQVMKGRNLPIIGQLSLSDRIRRTLRINLDPCAVLFIWPMEHVQSCDGMPASAGLLLPLHVVVSGHPGARTEVHILKSLRLEDEAEMGPVRQLLADVSQALETIAMRVNLAESCDWSESCDSEAVKRQASR